MFAEGFEKTTGLGIVWSSQDKERGENGIIYGFEALAIMECTSIYICITER